MPFDESTAERPYGWGPPAHARPLNAAHWEYRWLPALDDELSWTVKDHNYQMAFDEMIRYPSSREFTDVLKLIIGSSWTPCPDLPGLFCKKDLATAITDWTIQFPASDIRKEFEEKMAKYRNDRRLFTALGQRLIRMVMLRWGGGNSMENRVSMAIMMREEMGFPTRVPVERHDDGRVAHVAYDLGLRPALASFAGIFDDFNYSDVESDSETEA